MFRRILIFFGICAFLAIVAWGAIVLMNRKSRFGNEKLIETNSTEESSTASPAGNEQLPDVAPTANINVEPPAEKKMSQEEVEQLELGNFLKNFAARLATYSSQNVAANLIELLPLASGDAHAYLESLRDQNQSLRSEYVGITSQSLTIAWQEYVPGRDEYSATVGLLRVETRGNEEETYNQDVTLNLIKEGEGWKVSGIEWGERY